MGFTYAQLQAQQREQQYKPQQHFNAIASILEARAFASSWAHSGQVGRHLFAKLKKTENHSNLAVVYKIKIHKGVQ